MPDAAQKFDGLDASGSTDQQVSGLADQRTYGSANQGLADQLRRSLMK
jgi:hypothetical protein